MPKTSDAIGCELINMASAHTCRKFQLTGNMICCMSQETALRSESQLESTRRSLIELDEGKQAGKEETESAKYNIAANLLHMLC